MATPGPSPSKLVEDSDTAAFSPQISGNQQALEVEDVIEFVEPLPDELQCPLCLEFLKEPTLTSCCGHHFCRECINRAITHSHVCPLCNDQGFQTFFNKEKQRLVNALKVYCKWKSRGCEWVGELGRLEHHLDVEEGDCGCVEVECEFGPVGCVAKLPRKDLQRHKEENVHKHIVLMSVMSLKSNEAFLKELREQRVELEGLLRQQQVEFQQQLKQKDEEIQAIQESLQQQVEVTQDLRGQLLQNVESKQQMIANLERQLKGEAEQLARVEVELTENAQQFVKVERKLQDKDQQLTMYERKNEKQLGDIERKWLEEKEEVSRQVSEIDKKVEEEKIQNLQGRNQTVLQIADLRKRIEQIETSLREEQDQVNEKLKANEKRLDKKQLEGKQEVDKRVAEVYKTVQEAKTKGKANEKRLDVVEKKQQEEKLDIIRRVAEVDKKVEEKGEELQKVQTQFQKDNNQMDEEMTGLRMRIQQVETLLTEGQDELKDVNGKAQKLEEQLMTFIPPPDFTMTDFEQYKKKDDIWFSPPFHSHIGGYKMCFNIRAKGQGRGEGTHLSVFVHLMRGEHDDHLKWPFHADITVQLLNQRTGEEHMEHTIHFNDNTVGKSKNRVTGCDRAEFGWGIFTFIAHSALSYNSAKNTEYLRNDCLKFRVTNVKLTNF